MEQLNKILFSENKYFSFSGNRYILSDPHSENYLENSKISFILQIGSS